MSDEIWSAALEQLSGEMTDATYNTHLRNSKLIGIQAAIDGAPDVYTVRVDSKQSAEWLNNRLKFLVVRVLTAQVEKEVDVKFEYWKPEFKPVDLPEPLDAAAPEAEFSGVYHDRRNAIIQPHKVEVNSQYFRLKWRPLLGPLLSELVRELRQRCHYQSGRDTHKTTYKALAAALGISEPTVKRALAKDDTGKFKNEYLNYFIQDATTVKKQNDKGQFYNSGTRFTIYLDEPLTPKDEEK